MQVCSLAAWHCDAQIKKQNRWSFFGGSSLANHSLGEKVWTKRTVEETGGNQLFNIQDATGRW